MARLRLTLLLAATALVLATGDAPREAAGASTGPLCIVAQRSGLRLGLCMKHRVYPRNALIQVWAVERNTSRHTLWLLSGGPLAPGKYDPQVQVLDAAGRSLPLSLTTYFPYTGPPVGPSSLAPGATVGGEEDVVLRGSQVRVGVTLLRGQNAPVQSGMALYTRSLHVRLLSPDPPTVRVSAGNGRPSATIVRPLGVRGFPLAVYYADCGGANYDERIYWSRVSTHFISGCSPLYAWHVLVGWRGHSVAAIEWPGGAASPSVWLPTAQ